MPADVHQKVRLCVSPHRHRHRGALPLLDVVGGRCSEHVLPTHDDSLGHALGVEQRRTNALLVVGENGRGLTRHQVPRPHRRVGAARHHLRLARLRRHAVHSAAVAAQHHHLRLGADVPHAADAVTAAREDHVQRGVRGDAVHTAQVPMVGTDHLVVFQVPALHRLVLAAGEQVWRPRRDGHAAHRVGVTRQRQLQVARRQVPDLRIIAMAGWYLDGAIRATGREPLVAHIHCHTADPAQVTRNHTGHLPRSMPFRNWNSLIARTQHKSRRKLLVRRLDKPYVMNSLVFLLWLICNNARSCRPNHNEMGSFQLVLSLLFL